MLKQECKQQVVALEDPLNAEYVDPLWEGIQRQEEASRLVREVASQVELNSDSCSYQCAATWRQFEDKARYASFSISVTRSESADTNGNTKMQTSRMMQS